ncbi:type III secretion system (T3SS) inner membrane Yop/YscD-like protein [Frondihabitans sp. PhB188]|uniref:FhaA domain-containing protein n=1 Tax=Frondihabitans sp. PhB188 TaxID=2485200 RepID=UPI000F4ACB00|nr:DUF3662 and FHA domain-containing protein [Frondihabitans sp. PhB188]ROQ37111.1 type III secretion system (T3SS) inner membrane Yop/YscD-like protein [Frondihabitans sp. PhB188]
MGLLDNFERRLERAVNGTFSKTFRSGVQPLEITAALKREMDVKAAVVSRERILTPNEFTVALASKDFARMDEMGRALVDELAAEVEGHARKQSYSFAGRVRIELRLDERLTTGILRIDSANVREEDVVWTPVVEVEGTQHSLPKGRTVIGRGSEADITVQDTGTSRKHVEILWDGQHAQATDLGSTNGSKLDGVPLTKAVVQPDSVIQIGRTRIVFRVLPVSTSRSGSADGSRTGHNPPEGGALR